MSSWQRAKPWSLYISREGKMYVNGVIFDAAFDILFDPENSAALAVETTVDGVYKGKQKMHMNPPAMLTPGRYRFSHYEVIQEGVSENDIDVRVAIFHWTTAAYALKGKKDE